MLKKISLFPALIFLALNMFSTSASAFACANCVNEVTFQLFAGRLETALELSRTRIIAAIQGASTAQTTATAESAKIVADANTKTAGEMKKADIERNAVPLDPCGVTAAARGGSQASSNRPAASGRGGGGGPPNTPTAGATKEMAELLAIASGDKPAPPPELAAAMAAKGACGTFAKGGVREASCKGAGFSTGVSSGFPNADIRAETLFDGPQNPNDISQGVNRKLTIKPGNSPEKTAVAAFIRNLETPVDLRTLTAKEVNSEAGRNYMALRDSYDASISLASKPLRDQESMITANALTLPILKQLLKSEDRKFIISYLDRVFPSWKTDGISYAELMNLEASRRYLNEDWHVRMAGANEKQLLAEQVQMLAFSGWTSVSMLERTQQLGIIQGASAAAAIRTEKMPMLVAAYKAAKR